jgi:ribonuclease PH
MRLPDWKTCAGYLAVIAALALSLPGVRAVRAEDEVAVISVNLVDSAPTCDPSSESGAARSVTVSLEGVPDRPKASRSVALNTQGYSYRPPAVDPKARRLEQR